METSSVALEYYYVLFMISLFILANNTISAEIIDFVRYQIKNILRLLIEKVKNV